MNSTRENLIGIQMFVSVAPDTKFLVYEENFVVLDRGKRRAQRWGYRIIGLTLPGCSSFDFDAFSMCSIACRSCESLDRSARTCERV